mgnify:CR=1 FL=1
MVYGMSWWNPWTWGRGDSVSAPELPTRSVDPVDGYDPTQVRLDAAPTDPSRDHEVAVSLALQAHNDAAAVLAEYADDSMILGGGSPAVKGKPAVAADIRRARRVSRAGIDKRSRRTGNGRRRCRLSDGVVGRA